MPRRHRRRARGDQPSLFHLSSNRPRWNQLPHPVQRDVIELLARLLRQAASSGAVVVESDGAAVGGEAADE